MAEPGVVLDAAAVVAVVLSEEGWELAAPHLPTGTVSAVNLSEILFRVNERRPGFTLEQWAAELRTNGLTVEPFTQADALEVARLRPLTSSAGLSFGDRACLALARRLARRVVTTEHRWRGLAVGVEVDFIRPPPPRGKRHRGRRRGGRGRTPDTEG